MPISGENENVFYSDLITMVPEWNYFIFMQINYPRWPPGTVTKNSINTPGLEKSSVLPVLDRFLKLKTDLFLNKKLKSRSIKLCISQDFAIHRLTLSPVRIVHT